MLLFGGRLDFSVARPLVHNGLLFFLMAFMIHWALPSDFGGTGVYTNLTA